MTTVHDNRSLRTQRNRDILTGICITVVIIAIILWFVPYQILPASMHADGICQEAGYMEYVTFREAGYCLKAVDGQYILEPYGRVTQ